MNLGQMTSLRSRPGRDYRLSLLALLSASHLSISAPSSTWSHHDKLPWTEVKPMGQWLLPRLGLELLNSERNKPCHVTKVPQLFHCSSKSGVSSLLLLQFS